MMRIVLGIVVGSLAMAIVVVSRAYLLMSTEPAFLTPAAGMPTERSSELSNLEAMTQARQPAWFAATVPVVAAIGVLFGASLTKAKHG
jgi:hypothetical protein